MKRLKLDSDLFDKSLKVEQETRNDNFLEKLENLKDYISSNCDCDFNCDYDDDPK